MSSYKFIPNAFATAMFNLAAKEYRDDNGLTSLMERTLGIDNYNRYVFAQDPLCGKGMNEPADIKIVLNSEVLDLKKMNVQDLQYQKIGVVMQLS